MQFTEISNKKSILVWAGKKQANKQKKHLYLIEVDGI